MRQHGVVDIGQPDLPLYRPSGEGQGKIARAAGHIEHAREPSRTPLRWMVNAFHSRCMPPDIRSFIRS